ncbi:MAG: hypothetical protein AAGF90_11935, partial [Pseudomonadota bacterium]
MTIDEERAADPPNLRARAYGFLVFVAIAAVAGAAALGFGGYGAARLEAAAEARAALALEVGGHDWARVEVDGLAAAIDGQAPNEARRLAAVAAARGALASLAPAAALEDLTRAAPGAEEPAPPPSISLLRGLGDVAVSGATPDAEAREALRAALAEAAPRLAVHDLSRTNARPFEGGRDWSFGAVAAAKTAARLIHGRVDLSPGRFAASGLAA